MPLTLADIIIDRLTVIDMICGIHVTEHMGASVLSQTSPPLVYKDDDRWVWDRDVLDEKDDSTLATIYIHHSGQWRAMHLNVISVDGEEGWFVFHKNERYSRVGYVLCRRTEEVSLALKKQSLVRFPHKVVMPVSLGMMMMGSVTVEEGVGPPHGRKGNVNSFRRPSEFGFEEVFEWMGTTIKDEWSVGQSRSSVHFTFKRDTDAAMFKLRW